MSPRRRLLFLWFAASSMVACTSATSSAADQTRPLSVSPPEPMAADRVSTVVPLITTAPAPATTALARVPPTSPAPVPTAPPVVATAPPLGAIAGDETPSDFTLPPMPAGLDLPALPGQPAGVEFPTTQWTLGELPAALDAPALELAVEEAFGPTDGDRVRSLVVVVGGRLVYERYHAPDSASTVFDSFSVAKSFTSAVVGLAAGDGLLEVAAPAERPEWAEETDPRRAITVEDLLHMSSGLEWTEGMAEYSPYFAAASGAAYTAGKPLAAEPGTVWNYSTGTTNILTDIVARELGGGDQLTAYVRSRLLDPIGARSVELSEDATGVWRGGLGANATALDFARFGLLFLRDGVWDGQRILPAGWVDYSRTPSPTSDHYGKQWWLDVDGRWFEARGLYGQRIRVVPELDAVIVATTHPDGDTDTLVAVVHRLLDAAIG